MVVEHLIFPWTLLSFTFTFLIAFVIGIGLWIWALVDCLKSELSDGDKILWVLLIIVFNVIGAIIYLILAKTRTLEKITITNQKKGKRLYKDSKHKLLAGVSSGMAEYFNVDVVFVRLLWIFLGLLSAGTAVIAYIIATFIIPEKERPISQGQRTDKKKASTTKRTSKKTITKKEE